MFPKIVCSRNEITLKFCGTFWNHEKVVSSLNSFHSKCVANHFRAEQSLIWHFYFLNHITLNPLSILSNRANRRISIKSYLCLHLQNASKIHWFFEGNEGDSILFTIQTLLHQLKVTKTVRISWINHTVVEWNPLPASERHCIQIVCLRALKCPIATHSEPNTFGKFTTAAQRLLCWGSIKTNIVVDCAFHISQFHSDHRMYSLQHHFEARSRESRVFHWIIFKDSVIIQVR